MSDNDIKPLEQDNTSTVPVSSDNIGNISMTPSITNPSTAAPTVSTAQIPLGTSVSKTSPGKHVAVESEDASGAYTPVFGDTVRTVIYIVCGVLTIIGGLSTAVSAVVAAPLWLTLTCAVCAYLAPSIGLLFGVVYNPVRMANKQ